VNAAGTVLAEAQDRSPQAVTLKAHATKRGAVAVTGQVKQGGKGVTSATVKIMAGKKVIATAKTAAGGYFKASARTTARSLTAIATIGARDLPSCSQPILAPLQCVSATVGGFTTTSDATLVTK
jgi:hypothetical protein